MPIEFYCNQCYSQVVTPEDTGGKQGRCPKCGSIVTIPAAAGPATSAEGPVISPVRYTDPSRSSPSPAMRNPTDPFRPTRQQESAYSESVQKQFGIKEPSLDLEKSHWGEDKELSLKMRKAIAEERAKNRLVGPAQILITLAAVNLFIVVVTIAGLLVFLISQTESELEVNSFWITLGIIITAAILIDATMIFVGGNHMRHARSYSMAYAGIVFALLPLNLLFFLTIPFGFWALKILNDPGVGEGFKRR